VTYEQVEYSTSGRIARVTLNRPQYRNAQSSGLLHEVDRALSEADADPSVRVIILSGAGEAFSAGHDLGTPEQVQAREQRPEAPTEVEDHFAYSWEHFVDMSLRWRDLPKPTIAQVHGWCIFGGWLVASAMDMIVAADDARFMTALLQYFPLPFDVGPRKAKELLFDNRIIGAQEALELGFVNRVVPKSELENETTALAERIAESPAFYLRMVKLAVNQAQDAMGFRTAVQGAHAHYMLSQLSNSQFRRRQQREGKLSPDEPVEPNKRMPLVAKLLHTEERLEEE
jgi:enoyl-CoA hydratase